MEHCVAIVFADQVREDTRELMKLVKVAQENPEQANAPSPSKFTPSENTNLSEATANVTIPQVILDLGGGRPGSGGHSPIHGEEPFPQRLREFARLGSQSVAPQAL